MELHFPGYILFWIITSALSLVELAVPRIKVKANGGQWWKAGAVVEAHERGLVKQEVCLHIHLLVSQSTIVGFAIHISSTSSIVNLAQLSPQIYQKHQLLMNLKPAKS